MQGSGGREGTGVCERGEHVSESWDESLSTSHYWIGGGGGGGGG